MTQPFVGRNPIVAALQRQRGQVEAIRENTSRQAWSYAHLLTYGAGQFTTPEPQMFGCTFIKQPDVAVGLVVISAQPDPGPINNLYTGAVMMSFPGLPGSVVYPQVTAGVASWITNDRGYFIGAHLFAVIEDVFSGSGLLDLDHSFTFSGVAIKDLLGVNLV
jgi:hypothetical protein